MKKQGPGGPKKGGSVHITTPGSTTDYETASGFWQGRVRHVGVLSMGANGYVNRKFNYSSLNRRN